MKDWVVILLVVGLLSIIAIAAMDVTATTLAAW